MAQNRKNVAEDFFKLLLEVYQFEQLDKNTIGFRLSDPHRLHDFQLSKLRLPASHTTLSAKTGIALAERRLATAHLKYHLGIFNAALARDDFAELIPRWLMCTEWGGFWHALIPAIPYESLDRIAGALDGIDWLADLYNESKYWIIESRHALGMTYIDPKWPSLDEKLLIETFERPDVVGFQPAICTHQDGSYSYSGLTYAAKRLTVAPSQLLQAPLFRLSFVQDLEEILKKSGNQENIVRYSERRRNPSLIIQELQKSLDTYFLDRGPQSDVLDTIGNLLVYYKAFSDLSKRMSHNRAFTPGYVHQLSEMEAQGSITSSDEEEARHLLGLSEEDLRILRQQCVFGTELFRSLETIYNTFPRRPKSMEVLDFNLERAHSHNMERRSQMPKLDWSATRHKGAGYSAHSFVSEIKSKAGRTEGAKLVVSYTDSISAKSTLFSGYLFSPSFESYLARYAARLPAPRTGGTGLAYRYDMLQRINELLRKEDRQECRNLETELASYEDKSGIATINRSVSQGIMCKVIDLRKLDESSLPEELRGLDRNVVILDLEYALGDQLKIFTQEIARQIAKPWSLWATTKVAGIGRDIDVGDILIPHRSFGSDLEPFLRQHRRLGTWLDTLEAEGCFSQGLTREYLEKIIAEITRGSSPEAYKLLENLDTILSSNSGRSSTLLVADLLKKEILDITHLNKPLKNELADNAYGPTLAGCGLRFHTGNIGLVDSVVLQDSTLLKVSNAVTRQLGCEIAAIDMECDYIGQLIEEGTIDKTALAYFTSDHPVKGITLGNGDIADIYSVHAKVNLLPFQTLRQARYIKAL